METTTQEKIESWFKSDLERLAVRSYLNNEIYCLGNEFQELYAQVNECWMDNVSNLMTPIETDKREYFNYVKEYISEDLRDLIDAMKEWYENGQGNDDYGPYDNYYNQYIEHLRDNQEIQEIFQWFIVSNWLADKLESIGEPVLYTDNHALWGRTCYGQSIELDGTLQKVYRYTQEKES